MLKENALFNEKTIKRLCSKTKITSKQKKAANLWFDKLEANSLKKETKHYLEFRNHILRDILGYDEPEIKFEEENIEFSANDPVGNRAIYFEVKGTSTKDLFAKQPRAKKEHETPVKQLWDYMSQDATLLKISLFSSKTMRSNPSESNTLAISPYFFLRIADKICSAVFPVSLVS